MNIGVARDGTAYPWLSEERSLMGRSEERSLMDRSEERSLMGLLTREGAGKEAAARSLTIGVIASECPPDHGGMQEHASGLIGCLAEHHQVILYTGKGSSAGSARGNVAVRPTMRWQLPLDLRALQSTPVDAWISLNAGLAPYGRSLKAPLFAYVHGNDFIRPWLPCPDRPRRLMQTLLGEQSIQNWRKRRIGAGLRSARWIFANSGFSRRLCANLYGLSEARISVVAPGIRSEFFQDSQPCASSTLRLITVSRLCAGTGRKNIEGVIEAIAALKGEIPVSYTVVGDGDDLPRLRALAERMGIAANVRFLGSVDTERLIAEFARADAFILAVKPRADDVEGFGMVYAEAAASGLPAIASRTGGISDVVADGLTGMLLDDVSADGIAAGVRRFWRERAHFNRNAIRAKAEYFAASHCSAQIASTITRMLP